MDRRLSGALAWGALILIVGIPGSEMLTRQPAAPTAGVVDVPSGSLSVMSEWQSTGMAEPDRLAGPPAPPVASTTSDTASMMPDAASAMPPEPVETTSVTEIAPATNETFTSLASSDTLPDVTEIATAPIETIKIDTAPAAYVPIETTPLAPGASEPLDAAGIAARVRDTILTEPGASAAATAVARATSAPEPETERIPYPAPASQRPRQPVAVATVAPDEPAPGDITPDNAIFFENWVSEPPMRPGRDLWR